MFPNVQSPVLFFFICASFIGIVRAVAIPSKNELLQIQIFSNKNFTGSTTTYEYKSSLEICLEVNLNTNLTQAADAQNSAKLIRGRCVLLCNLTCNEGTDALEKCLEMKAVNTFPAKINATSQVVRSIRRCRGKKMQNNKPQIEFY